MSKTIRIYYIGGQYTDFANSTEDDYTNLIGVLNNNEKSFVLNNQWINKENIITVIQFEVKDEKIISENAPSLNEEIVDYLNVENQQNAHNPSRCCYSRMDRIR